MPSRVAEMATRFPPPLNSKRRTIGSIPRSWPLGTRRRLSPDDGVEQADGVHRYCRQVQSLDSRAAVRGSAEQAGIPGVGRPCWSLVWEVPPNEQTEREAAEGPETPFTTELGGAGAATEHQAQRRDSTSGESGLLLRTRRKGATQRQASQTQAPGSCTASREPGPEGH